jgi:hypothetical protein
MDGSRRLCPRLEKLAAAEREEKQGGDGEVDAENSPERL